MLAACSAVRQTAVTAAKPAQVRPLDYAGNTDPLDRDRLALSRFVGAWDFEGWYQAPDLSRRETKGLAAGMIENRYFLLLDTARRVKQSASEEFLRGSMLLSVEPGIGLMLTAWGDQSPAVHRLRGQVQADGSLFVFDEVRPPKDKDCLKMVLHFDSDDRWIADFYRVSGGTESLAASYLFLRAR